MKFLITIFQDEDSVYIAECPSIRGCFSQEHPEKETEANILDRNLSMYYNRITK